jgi:hypothetical protein
LTPASTATCPTGKVLLGGGATITQSGGTKGAVAVSQPTPTPNPTGWTATGITISTQGGSALSVTAYAVCSG